MNQDGAEARNNRYYWLDGGGDRARATPDVRRDCSY